MDQLQRVLAEIQRRLGELSATQKLLIASLTVIAGMAFFVVSLWAGKQDRVTLFSGDSAEYQTQVVGYLASRGVEAKVANGEVTVPAEQRYTALGLLGSQQMLPTDSNAVLFSTLRDNQSWTNTEKQNDDLWSIAQMNELARVISNFPGIDRARVFISNPRQRGGIGKSFVRPAAQVTVFPRGGGLSQQTVDALAAMLVGSVAGLDISDVKVINGMTQQWHRVRDPEDLTATTYLEAVAKHERYVQDKIGEQLAFIPNVIVAVNAMVDAALREVIEETIKPEGKGSVNLIKSTTSSTNSSEGRSSGGELGVRANARASVNTGGGDRVTSSEETTNDEFDPRYGSVKEKKVPAPGMPTQINVAVNVPRDWVATAMQQEQGLEEAPANADLESFWRSEMQPRLRQTIEPIAQAPPVDGGTMRESIVVVSMMPVALATANGLGAGGGGGGGGGLGAIASGGMIDRIVLGVLAIVSVGAMLLLVKKASKQVDMPTAEEIVGVPPPITGPDEDLIGEAEEGDSAMLGIELDDEHVTSRRMLEEISEMIKAEPDDAAAVINRWVRTDD